MGHHDSLFIFVYLFHRTGSGNIGAAFLFCVRLKVGDGYFKVLFQPVRDHLQPVSQGIHRIFVQLYPLIGQPCGFLDGSVIAGERGEGGQTEPPDQ